MRDPVVVVPARVKVSEVIAMVSDDAFKFSTVISVGVVYATDAFAGTVNVRDDPFIVCTVLASPSTAVYPVV